MMKMQNIAARLLMLALAGIAFCAHADVVSVAAAANFTAAMKKLAPLYEQQTGNRLAVSFGSTGQLYAQIRNGAPFEIFLSADTATPQQLIADGQAVAGSYFVYARGRLVLWSSAANYVDEDGSILQRRPLNKIAIANPKTAPYGQAALETLSALKLRETLQPKFVTGENIAQTQQFIRSGNVPLGFIALAQVQALPAAERGSYWLVPAQLHRPIEQGAVLLKGGNAKAAQTFLVFLKSPEAIAIIRQLGYEVPSLQ